MKLFFIIIIFLIGGNLSFILVSSYLGSNGPNLHGEVEAEPISSYGHERPFEKQAGLRSSYEEEDGNSYNSGHSDGHLNVVHYGYAKDGKYYGYVKTETNQGYNSGSNYRKLKDLGKGSYGSVYLAHDTIHLDQVAVKRLHKQYDSWKECLMLREVQSLKSLSYHPNIIRLREIIRENRHLFLIFDYMPINLLELIQERKKKCEFGGMMDNDSLKLITFQIFSGLRHLHQSGYFHRDLKPDNLLVKPIPSPDSDTPQNLTDYSVFIVKLGDFGLARKIRTIPPFTSYVSTRWYRAPELCLQSDSYDMSVDIWAAGCIVAELNVGTPLFSGSSDLDMIHRIGTVIGSPDVTSENLLKLTKKLGITIKNYEKNAGGLGQHVKRCNTELSSHESVEWQNLLKLLSSIFQWEGSRRPSASACLKHQYFDGIDSMKIFPIYKHEINSERQIIIDRQKEKLTKNVVSANMSISTKMSGTTIDTFSDLKPSNSRTYATSQTNLSSLRMNQSRQSLRDTQSMSHLANSTTGIGRTLTATSTLNGSIRYSEEEFHEPQRVGRRSQRRKVTVVDWMKMEMNLKTIIMKERN
ncbi:hypothetical protein SNEBB_001912 [Seison nebaliae]|nr:hypothetical protein SNEBB_001912 [Seison nebaliae]